MSVTGHPVLESRLFSEWVVVGAVEALTLARWTQAASGPKADQLPCVCWPFWTVSGVSGELTVLGLAQSLGQGSVFGGRDPHWGARPFNHLLLPVTCPRDQASCKHLWNSLKVTGWSGFRTPGHLSRSLLKHWKVNSGLLGALGKAVCLSWFS
jgi:hypothetical protein